MLSSACDRSGGEKCKEKREKAVDPDGPGVAYLGEEVLEHDGIYHTTCNNVRKRNKQASAKRHLHLGDWFYLKDLANSTYVTISDLCLLILRHK